MKLPEYGSYSAMKTRCLNPRHKIYKRYGARGIIIDERWLGRDGFANFLTDLGRRPPGHTIHRIDNNLGYSKANCQWATRKKQQRNRHNAKLTEELAEEIRREDFTIPVAVLARAYGVSDHTIRAVLSCEIWN